MNTTITVQNITSAPQEINDAFGNIITVNSEQSINVEVTSAELATIEAKDLTFDVISISGGIADLTAFAASANVNILATGFTALTDGVSTLEFSCSVGAGVLSYVKGTTVVTLNASVTAGVAYPFTIPLSAGETYNLQYSKAGNVTVDWIVNS